MGVNIMTIDSEDFDIQYSSDGSLFVEMNGATGFNINSEPGAVRTVRTLKGSTNIEQGPGPGQASVDVGNFLPHLQLWKDLRQHFSDSDILTFRTQSKEGQTIFASAATRLVAIADTGVATLSGSGVLDAEVDMAVGYVIEAGGDKYVVEALLSATTMQVSPEPANNVGAAQFTVSIPRIRRDIRGKVIDMNTDNLSEGSQLANAILISLKSLPGDWNVI